MEKILILIAFIFWVLGTIILVCSVLGLLLFLRTDGEVNRWQGDKGRSSWCTIGVSLVDKLVS